MSLSSPCVHISFIDVSERVEDGSAADSDDMSEYEPSESGSESDSEPRADTDSDDDDGKYTTHHDCVSAASMFSAIC